MKLAIFSIILVLSISKNSSSQDPFENSIASLSKIITDSLNNSGKKQIAVTSITESDNRGQNLREYIRESVEEYVHANSKGYKVLERQKLQLVLDEQKVSSEAIINDSTRVKLGRLFGVDAIVLGSITLTTNEIKLSLRAIDIVTGEIIALKSQVISKTERIKDLLEEQIKTEDKAQQAIQPVPEYNDPDCELKNRGAIRFTNNTKYDRIMVQSWGNKVYILKGESRSFYEELAGNKSFYFAYEMRQSDGKYIQKFTENIQIPITKCTYSDYPINSAP